MAQTTDILETVRDRLKAMNPDLAVEYFPDSPDEYRLNHPKGALLISYPGSEWGESLDIDLVVQERQAMIGITLVMRLLNGKEGAIERLDLVRQQLRGFRPTHCGKLHSHKEKFLQEKQGVWYYVSLFKAVTLDVEDAGEEGGRAAEDITFLPVRGS